MNSQSPIRHPKLIRTLLVVISLLVIFIYRVPLWNGLLMFGNWQALVAYLQQFETYGLIVLALLMLLQVFLALIPGQALVVAAGYLYGGPVTILVVSSTAIIGSEIAFWLARRYGRPLIYQIAPPKLIDHWDRLAGHLGPSFYFLTFLLPIFPADMMCYVAGLGKVSPKGFFVANFAGRLISTIAFTLLGAYKFRPPLWFWITTAVCLTVILTTWTLYKKRYLRKEEDSKPSSP
jgi:uncharacterized membrane protein YdjX (TVP38/TMEM64 family)